MARNATTTQDITWRIPLAVAQRRARTAWRRLPRVAGVALVASGLLILNCYAFFASRWPEAQFPWTFVLKALPLAFAYALIEPLAYSFSRSRYRIKPTGFVREGTLFRWERFRGLLVSPDPAMPSIPRVLLYRRDFPNPLIVFLDPAVADDAIARLREWLPELDPAKELSPDAQNPVPTRSSRWAILAFFLAGSSPIAGFTLLISILEYFSFTHHGHDTTSVALIAFWAYLILTLAVNGRLLKRSVPHPSQPRSNGTLPLAWLLGLFVSLLWLPWFFLLLR